MAKKIFVAMSGGVDSSVAALLLKKRGYQVCGVYMKCWNGLTTEKGIKFEDSCDWERERADALRVAVKLSISFKTYDFTKEYERDVIDYFFDEYKNGRTPNPDVMCNKEIKFKSFLQKALEEGADYIATGHYVRLRRKFQIPKNRLQIYGYELSQAKDKNKDQSYFLWTLQQKQLRHCLFPVGEFFKTEVRQIASEANLPVAQKKDSQGICFVGQVSVRDFLRARLPSKEGLVITTDGQVVGRHDGAHLYTIGQRHGLNLSASLPYYVARKNLKKNILIVAKGNSDPSLYERNVLIGNLSWARQTPVEGQTYLARVRYRQTLQAATIKSINDKTCFLTFFEPQRAVTVGQSVVLYKGERVLGGGVIEQS